MTDKCPSLPSASKGVPRGVVRMELRHVQPFRQLLEAVLGRKTRFRDVEKDDKGGGCTIHLNPNAAAALDDSPPELMSFLDSIGAEYLPGVWKKRKLQEEPKVSCFETVKKPHKQAASSSFTFVELFAGIGGFRLGLESIGGRCVLASELNSHAASIYRQNFDHNCLVQGDILDLDSSCCGQFDMLTAGFPCQPFTDRGQKRGLDDDRGQMYLELVRILYDQQPRCFCLKTSSDWSPCKEDRAPSEQRESEQLSRRDVSLSEYSIRLHLADTTSTGK